MKEGRSIGRDLVEEVREDEDRNEREWSWEEEGEDGSRWNGENNFEKREIVDLGF